jgi:hypothetical protein
LSAFSFSRLQLWLLLLYIPKGIYRTTTELWALALTTSIEGIFKNHFSNLLQHESDYVLKIDDTLSKIASANVDPEIFQKLQSTLSGFKKRNITAGLKQYIADKPQFSNWPKNWTTLRNKSAHPDVLDESPEDFQIYLNQAFTCLAIFYHLLGRAIKFDGKLIAYGMPNWPSLSSTDELLTAEQFESQRPTQ